ncbi:MAG: leucine-rich repeat protein [Clostridia bacterium]|nr:leucine-rich repeat protein [Clostridia bacterium]
MAKKNLFKKTLALALAAVLTFGAAPLAGLCAIELPSLGSLTASAAEETDYLYTTADNQITITGHNNPVGKLAIPEAINDLPVTKISSGAFNGCEMITSVSIPSTVSTVELNAFANCSSLTTVTFDPRSEDQILEIGSFAFSNCTSLSSINLEDSNVSSMGGNVFRDCSALEKIVMPDTLTNVEGGVFYRCTSLRDVTLSENMTALNDFGFRLEGFFYGCTSLSEIEIPANITTIGYDAFHDSGIRKVTFAENNKLTTVSSLAFCNSKLQSITIPATVTLIDSQAFQDCKNLSSVTFEKRSEDQVLQIGSHVFSGCAVLSSINLEDSNVINMGGNVFRNCSTLEKIVMPDTLINVDGGVFYGCTNLRDVTLSKNMTALNCFGARLEGFFYECENLTEITIPANVKIIDHDAFCGSGIQKITFEENSKLTTISSQAFCNSNLQSIIIPATVTSIERIAFQNTDLEWVVFEGNKNLEIANHVFDGCSNLTDVYYSGTEEEWNEIIINENGNGYLLNAAMHFNFTGVPQDKLKNTEYGVSASFDYGCYDEDVELSIKPVSKDREPGGVYIPDDMTLERVGCFDISIVKKGSDVPAEKKNDGMVTIRMPIPEKFKGLKDFRIVHYLKKGGYDNLSTSETNEKLKITVDGDYLVFSVSEFSDFDVFTLVPAENDEPSTPSDKKVVSVSIASLPSTTSYTYRSENVDLSGMKLTVRYSDGTIETVTDTSEMKVSGFNGKKLGDQTVTVEYEGATAEFEVNVSYAWWQWIIRILLLGFLWY